MIEEYMSNLEYQTHFENLRGLRFKIARSLPIRSGMYILDVATGEGFFAVEVAKLFSDVKIIGIDISQKVVQDARENIQKQNLQDRIKIVRMDAADMSFDREEFDIAINFTGFEEIYMTRGKAGVQRTFLEVNRVLKPHSYFCFVVMPPKEMETEAQKLEVALFDYLCGARYLSSKEYEGMIRKGKFSLVDKRNYYSGIKFTPQQAKSEIRYAIKQVPKIYGINPRSFSEVWNKFGKSIEENGLGCYSKVVFMITQKVGDI